MIDGSQFHRSALYVDIGGLQPGDLIDFFDLARRMKIYGHDRHIWRPGEREAAREWLAEVESISVSDSGLEALLSFVGDDFASRMLPARLEIELHNDR